MVLNDIFISYAHFDNEKYPTHEKGWVTGFHDCLQNRLNQWLGRKLTIWRDCKLNGNDDFNEEIKENLKNATFLVCVLSQRYVKSDCCREELKEFYEHAKSSEGIYINHKSRIFKVIKLPVELEKQPQEIQGSLGYEFYCKDEKDGNATRECDIYGTFGDEFAEIFSEKIDDLAQDIKNLKELSDGNNSETKYVYLAETTSDLKNQYDNIKRELRQKGYTVIPDQTLAALNSSQLENLVSETLQKCPLSIHLIGNTYAVIPEGGHESIVVLQNRLAASYYSKGLPKSSRLIWIPKDLTSSDERQTGFLKQLQTDAELQKGAEILQTTIEELKTHILDKLEKKPESLPDNNIEQKKKIYLIYGQEDQDDESLDAIDNYLFDKHNLEIVRSSFEEEPVKLSKFHREILTTCDGVIIYCGKTSYLWVQSKMAELRKASGYRQPNNSRLAKAIYLKPPLTKEKEKLHSNEFKIFIAEQSFNQNILNPFLEVLWGVADYE